MPEKRYKINNRNVCLCVKLVLEILKGPERVLAIVESPKRILVYIQQAKSDISDIGNMLEVRKRSVHTFRPLAEVSVSS